MATTAREVHESLGARFEAFEGVDCPVSYGDPGREFQALREGAALVDLPVRSHLSVRGDDRSEFLSRLLSNDVEALAPGALMEALLLTPKGMLISPLFVANVRDSFLIVAPAATHAAVRDRLALYVLSAAVEVVDESDRYARLGIHGPEAGSALEELGVPSDAGIDHGAVQTDIGGATVLLTPSRDLGGRGYDLHHAPEFAAKIIQAVVETGAVPAGWRAAEAVRILAGEPLFGAEITEGMLPPEIPALAERAISYTKGCYVGQETISRLKNYGRVNRELRGLLPGGERVPEPGAALTHNGRKVGVVTSACLPPDRETPIALGFVHRKHNEVGTRVEVEMQGALALATVVPAGGPW